jgi:hypothetical protein
MKNPIAQGLLNVAQALAQAAVEVATEASRPVVIYQQPRTVWDELFDTPKIYVTEKPVRKCTSNTPWQVCEDRDCYPHRHESRRDYSKLR